MVVTKTCRPQLGSKIMARLQNRPVCGDMFRKSCFVDLQELLFLIGNYWVYIDVKTSCLVTSLQFEEYFPPNSGFAEFRKCVVPFVPLSHSVRVVDVMHVADAVRVSLLYMLEQGFLGKYSRQPVTDKHMAFVSNLDEFNMCLWGRVIWDFTYRKLYTMLDNIEEHLNPDAPRVSNRHTYTLQGFVYSFKDLP
uniref:DUF1985 domain-containing protein n=1 Tax=Lactuca sativa TaxID=4236 RepID=A0A9R1XIM6_LACSA|nr:hypothetical protein LSAT_V11C400216210 [Lactuca sativa]